MPQRLSPLRRGDVPTFRRFCLSPLDTAFTPNAPVTPLTAAFTKNHPGWGPLRFPFWRVSTLAVHAAFPLFVFINLQIPLSATHVFSHLYKTPGVPPSKGECPAKAAQLRSS